MPFWAARRQALDQLRVDPADGTLAGADLATCGQQALRGAQEAGRSRFGPGQHRAQRPANPHAVLDHAQGRRALAAWLAEPGEGPVLEFEQLLKVFFADNGTGADTLESLRAAEEWARARCAESLAVGERYLEGEGPFPERLPELQLTSRFITDFYLLVLQWAQWASTIVEGWPDDPRQAHHDPAVVAETIERARTGTPPRKSDDEPKGPLPRRIKDPILCWDQGRLVPGSVICHASQTVARGASRPEVHRRSTLPALAGCEVVVHFEDLYFGRVGKPNFLGDRTNLLLGETIELLLRCPNVGDMNPIRSLGDPVE